MEKMETNFQTSFIPKKPVASQVNVHHHTSISVFMIIATILFIASIGGAASTFVLKSILLTSQTQVKNELKAKEDKFNLPLIDELKKANAKIDLAKQLLKNHIAVSEVLAILSKLTIDGVRFSGFEFDSVDALSPSASASSKIKLTGVANSYNSVAFQSDVFGNSIQYGTGKPLKTPILSDLSVDDKNNVLFNFSADIPQSEISYESVLTDDLKAEGVISQ